MNKEIWKDVVWYEWLYQISNFWHSRRLWKIIIDNRVKRFVRWRILRDTTTNLWYIINTLTKDWKQKKYLRSRLVAQAFHWLDINNKKIYVCHKDDNPLNNRVDNLFLWSQKDNMQDKVDKNRQTKWEDTHLSSITNNQAKEVIRQLKKWKKIFQVSNELWISYNIVRHIKAWNSWKWLS
jgi:hypothetical protein